MWLGRPNNKIHNLESPMTDSQLILALGGCAAVAALLGIKPPSVSGWKQIPFGQKVKLAVIAEDRGVCTRKKLFPDTYQDIWIELRQENVVENQEESHVQKVAL